MDEADAGNNNTNDDNRNIGNNNTDEDNKEVRADNSQDAVGIGRASTGNSQDVDDAYRASTSANICYLYKKEMYVTISYLRRW